MWLVCKSKDGHLFIQSRIEREMMLSILTEFENGVPSYVVKSFATEEQAENYVLEMFEINSLINKTIQ
jgi:hypothetical protein